MDFNESGADRLFRVFSGLLFAGAGLVLGGALGIVAYLLALFMFGTGAIGFCPIYRLFHVDTRKLSKS